MAQQLEHLAFGKMRSADDDINPRGKPSFCLRHGAAKGRLELVSPSLLHNRDYVRNFGYQDIKLIGRHALQQLVSARGIVESPHLFLMKECDIAFVKDRAILPLFTSLGVHAAYVAFCMVRK